jgi:hypothetical protein
VTAISTAEAVVETIRRTRLRFRTGSEELAETGWMTAEAATATASQRAIPIF